MNHADSHQKLEFLKQAKHYPGPPETIETRKTHMSWVFLAGKLVFKMKKPVKHSFLDYTTLSNRHYYCCKEVELNTRLAPGVYLGVAVLMVDDDERLHFNGNGKPVEYLIKMQRLPADLMLDQCIERGDIPEKPLAKIAEKLISFYKHAATINLSPEDFTRRISDEIQGDENELLSLEEFSDRDLIKDACRQLEHFSGKFKSRIEQRVAKGYIIDGHGDLRPEHICLKPDPVIFDCLEFSDELRRVDPLDELAFLRLECERKEAGQVTDIFLDYYRSIFGSDVDKRIFGFYKAKRALLRAKLSANHLKEREYRNEKKWVQKTNWYLNKILEETELHAPL